MATDNITVSPSSHPAMKVLTATTASLGTNFDGIADIWGVRQVRIDRWGRAFFDAGQGDERGIQEQNVATCEIAPRLSLNSQCVLSQSRESREFS
jgi:hypothetical protein